MVNGYRTVSLKGLVLRVPEAMPGTKVELRLHPDLERSVIDIRFWQKGRLLGSERAKRGDLPIVHF